jgi:hypothetical protein
MKTSPPSTLNADCLRHEAQRHDERMRELKALIPHLQRLQVHVPALQARGVTLWPSFISLDASRKGRPAVRLTAPMSDHSAHRLYRALVELGFECKDLHDNGSFAVVLLCLGALRVSLHVGMPLPGAAVPATAAGADAK